MPVLGRGGSGHGLEGAARGFWVVLSAWGCGCEPRRGHRSTPGMPACWQSSHQTRLSIPWGCRAGALPASDQAPGAAAQPNPTQTTPTRLHLSRRQPAPSQPPGRGHNTERSRDATWGRRTSTSSERPAPGPCGHPAHDELAVSPMLRAAGPTASARAEVTTPGGTTTTSTGAKRR